MTERAYVVFLSNTRLLLFLLLFFLFPFAIRVACDFGRRSSLCSLSFRSVPCVSRHSRSDLTHGRRATACNSEIERPLPPSTETLAAARWDGPGEPPEGKKPPPLEAPRRRYVRPHTQTESRIPKKKKKKKEEKGKKGRQLREGGERSRAFDSNQQQPPRPMAVVAFHRVASQLLRERSREPNLTKLSAPPCSGSRVPR